MEFTEVSLISYTVAQAWGALKPVPGCFAGGRLSESAAMARSETTPIQLKDNAGNTTSGHMKTTLYDSADRTRRAGQRLAACWAAAGVTLFIPIAHFVLVPGFLIAGPVLAAGAYRTEWTRDHAAGRCPACQAEVTLALEARDTLPKWTYCPACNAPLQLVEIP